MFENSVNFLQVRNSGFYITAVEGLVYAAYLILVVVRSRGEARGVTNLRSAFLNLLTFAFFLFSGIFYVLYLYFGSLVFPGFMKYAAGFGLILNFFYLVCGVLPGGYRTAGRAGRNRWRYFFGSDDRYFMMYSLYFFHMTLIAQLFFSDPVLVGEFLQNQHRSINALKDSFGLIFVATLPFYFLYSYTFEEILAHRNIAREPGSRFSENGERNSKDGSDSEEDRGDGFKFRPHRYMPNPEHPWNGGVGTSDCSGAAGSSRNAGSGEEYGREAYSKSQNMTDELRDAYSVLCVRPDAPTSAVHRSFRELSAKYSQELENIGRDSSLTAMRREIQCRKMLQLVQDAWKTVSDARNIETFD